MNNSKNSKQNENNNIKSINEFSQKDFQKENEIIIELEIIINNENFINILCDKNQMILDNKQNENNFKENNIEPPKDINYFNKDNTKLYLNDKEIEFNYKLKLKKIGKNKIKIKSNIKLLSLLSMFYNCNNIITIQFFKLILIMLVI